VSKLRSSRQFLPNNYNNKKNENANDGICDSTLLIHPEEIQWSEKSVTGSKH